MSVSDVLTGVCKDHPKRETSVRCNRCNQFICTRCMIQTPVGMRCRDCAQLRKLPQFDVSGALVLRSGLAGLFVSVVAWALISHLAFLRFFLSILVGAAVGEVMSRLSRRRTSRILEVVAVADVVLGLGLIVLLGSWDAKEVVTTIGRSPSVALSLLLPAAIASYVAVIKLR